VRRVFQDISLSSADVLIDIGCGKGRILALALAMQCGYVRGIDTSSVLCGCALRNLNKLCMRLRLDGNPYEVINEDAAEYKFMDDETVIFLFNPFGANTVTKLVKNLLQSIENTPHRCRIVYRNPVFGSLIGSRPEWRKTYTGTVFGDAYAVFSYEENHG